MTACAACTIRSRFTCTPGPARSTTCPSRPTPCLSATSSHTTHPRADRRKDTMPAAVAENALFDRALDVLRRAGNPFRNYFARNPDDDVCARYHVPELFAREREQLLGVVDLYRYDPSTHSEVVPVLGNKGAGKTHLLHSIKHGVASGWQLLVTPGTYQ